MSDARQYTFSEFLTLIKKNINSDTKNSITIDSLLAHLENCIALLPKMNNAFKEGDSAIANRIKLQQEISMIYQLPVSDLDNQNKKQLKILLKFLPFYIETLEKKFNDKIKQEITAEVFLETDMSNPTQAIFFKMMTTDDEKQNQSKPLIDDLIYKLFVKMHNIETHVTVESSLLDNTKKQFSELILKLTPYLDITTDVNKKLLEQIILMAHNYNVSIDEKIKNKEIKILKFTIEKHPVEKNREILSPQSSGLGHQLKQHGVFTPSSSPNPLSPLTPSTPSTNSASPVKPDNSPKK